MNSLSLIHMVQFYNIVSSFHFRGQKKKLGFIFYHNKSEFASSTVRGHTQMLLYFKVLTILAEIW